ncbi:glycosyltransferase family 4 protein [Seonamhaeicola maritimus]|uniref:Glycosyltransferase family 4 protein n=1 Tax=Seonamhaeicola maritimus TaxID=2591822 RepID=A0A5C7GKM7_9FLAO|nr:glycosyltransferase family 4 protein [Seonamhaeicola maritimus]TXG38883.1 glycosyltransferase family 4 protein [Seonamhaeicola maritimus]
MRPVLYIGNRLKCSGSNQTPIEVLGVLLEDEGYTTFYASSKLNKGLRFLDMLWACFRYRNQVDLVLIDTYSTLNFYYAYAVSRLCSCLNLKYVPILHGGNLPNRLESSSGMSKAIFTKAYLNVAPSLYLKESFERFGFDNIVHIPNTIDVKKYQYKERAFEEIKLLWVRSFSKIYNPELAVKVLKALKDEGFQTELCMVGPDADGSLKDIKLLANDIGVEVKFTGKLTKEAWIELSKDYNIFINTTNFDNMPLSVIEAMALGLPVVSTNVGGMPYLIEDGEDGILVNPDNVNEFIDAIKNMISDSKRATQMTVNARTKVQQYDWSIVKKLWHKVLN